jgi:hypothetical protein
VPASTVFSNPLAPWPYEKVSTISNLRDEATVDFTAARLGDVNQSWNAGLRTATQELELAIDSVLLITSDSIMVPVRASGFRNISSMQFTMEWDPAFIEVRKVMNGVIEPITGKQEIAQGKMTFLWEDQGNQSVSIEDGQPLFSLDIRSKGKRTPSSSILISSAITPALAYNDLMNPVTLNGRSGGIEIIDQAAMGYRFYPNYPNPAQDFTTIRFAIPKATEVSFEIYNPVGQLVSSVKKFYPQGQNSLDLNVKELKLHNGVYLIRMNSGNFSGTTRMLIDGVK